MNNFKLSLNNERATEVVELQEINEKYPGEVSCISVGNFINK